jgi:hypothetical protein
MTKRPEGSGAAANKLAHFLQPPTEREIAARASAAEEASGRPMRQLQAYAAGGFAYDRGESAQPPATVPRDRKEAWLKGWADQQAFMERQATGRKQKPPPSAAAPSLPPAHRCQWPLGDKRPFTLRGKPVVKPGSPYCAEHTRTAGRAGRA